MLSKQHALEFVHMDIEFPEPSDESFLEELERPPAFQFYASNWISSTSLMDAEQRGWYIQLLAWAWGNSQIQGVLPDDEDELRLIAGNRLLSTASKNKHTLAEIDDEVGRSDNEKRWRKVREKFVPSPEHPGFVHNPRLTKVLRRVEMYREGRKKRAKAGAEEKWRRWRKEHPEAAKTANNPSSTASISKQKPSTTQAGRKHNSSNAKPLLNSAPLSLPLIDIEPGVVSKSSSKPTLFKEEKFQVTNEMRDVIKKRHPELKEEDLAELRVSFCHNRYGQTQISWKRQFYNFVNNQITKYGYVPFTERPARQAEKGKANGKFESAAERNARIERENEEHIAGLRGFGSRDPDKDPKALRLPTDASWKTSE